VFNGGSLFWREDMSAIPAAPIHFREIFKVKPWGGRRLETLLGKRLPPDEPIGESWEISDHPHGMSEVDGGELAGRTLRELIERDDVGLIGRRRALELGGRFPLLYKFIDAEDFLSVQVHPGYDYARKHEEGDAGKSEAWYVIHAEPGAKIVHGLSPGTTRRAFSGAIRDGAVEEHVRFVEVKRGDVLTIPPGTVHAIGPGVVVAEIQENSDTTYRVYDWGRMGLDGKPRELHVEKALDVIGFAGPSEPLVTPEVLRDGTARHERLAANEKFVFDRYSHDGPFDIRPAELESFVILSCIGGRAELVHAQGTRAIALGETLLLPATLSTLTVRPQGPVELLAMSLPIRKGV
jgi:mannose-6-phosphate isomerase